MFGLCGNTLVSWDDKVELSFLPVILVLVPHCGKEFEFSFYKRNKLNSDPLLTNKTYLKRYETHDSLEKKSKEL